MANPYQILGVSPDASEEEIKKAYRKLSRIYHPDSNVGKSEAEQKRAEEKFKEVQHAYKAIVNGEARNPYSSDSSSYAGSGGEKRYGGPYGGGFNGYSGQTYTYTYGWGDAYTKKTEGMSKDDTYFAACANFLRNRMYDEALRTLRDIETHNGRWFYYSAMANAGLGNQTTALAHIQTALRFEPGNLEYRRFAERLNSGMNWYSEVGRSYGAPEVDGTGFCAKLCVASVLCNCCGGSSVCFVPFCL